MVSSLDFLLSFFILESRWSRRELGTHEDRILLLEVICKSTKCTKRLLWLFQSRSWFQWTMLLRIVFILWIICFCVLAEDCLWLSVLWPWKLYSCTIFGLNELNHPGDLNIFSKFFWTVNNFKWICMFPLVLNKSSFNPRNPNVRTICIITFCRNTLANT